MSCCAYTGCGELSSCDFWACGTPASLRLGNGRLVACCPGKVRGSLALRKVAGGRSGVAYKDLDRMMSTPELAQLREVWSGVVNPSAALKLCVVRKRNVDIAAPPRLVWWGLGGGRHGGGRLGQRVAAPAPGHSRDARLPGEQCCCAGPCCARPAVLGWWGWPGASGSALRLTLRGGERLFGITGGCRWQSCCDFVLGGGRAERSCVRWVSAPSPPCCSEIPGGA